MANEYGLLSLSAPVGKGQENRPDDVAALDNGLRQIDAYIPPPEYADGPQRYATEPVIAALERFQEKTGLKTDAIANPGGPTERAINNRLLNKPRGAGLLFEPARPLADNVGNGFKNDARDVASVQRRLGALDYMPEDPFDAPPGIITEATTNGMKRFQLDKGLTPDGWMAPGGETEKALEASVSDLARGKGNDWFDFVGRAGKAQGEIGATLTSFIPTNPSSAPEFKQSLPPQTNEKQETDGAVTPVGGGPADWLPFLLMWLARTGRGAAPSVGKRPPATPLPPPPIVPPAAPRSGANDEAPNTPTKPSGSSWLPYTPEKFRTNIDGLIVERRESKATADYDADLASKTMSQAQKVAKVMTCDIVHEAGARALVDRVDEKTGRLIPQGAELGQRQVGPKTQLGEGIKKPRSGHSFPDMAFWAKNTNRRLFINSYTPYVSGIPNKWEKNSSGTLQLNAATGDIVLLVPKLKPTEILDAAKFDAIVYPLLVEICRPYVPNPTIDGAPKHIEPNVKKLKP